MLFNSEEFVLLRLEGRVPTSLIRASWSTDYQSIIQSFFAIPAGWPKVLADAIPNPKIVDTTGFCGRGASGRVFLYGDNQVVKICADREHLFQEYEIIISYHVS